MYTERKEPTLEVWPELRFKSSKQDALDALIADIDANLPDGWERVLEKENKNDKWPRQYGYWLKSYGKAGMKIWLWQQTSFELFVKVACPDLCEDNAPYDQEKQAFGERIRMFREQVVDLVVDNHSEISVVYESGEKQLTDIVSEDIAKKLRLFSRTSNRGEAPGHPCDYPKWTSFIFAVYEDGARDAFPPSLLQEWLEKDGWLYEKSHDLSIRYERALELLEHYDRHREGLDD